MGLSPFEVLTTDLEKVFNLYVDCIIHDKKEKSKGEDKDIWVTSHNANWH